MTGTSVRTGPAAALVRRAAVRDVTVYGMPREVVAATFLVTRARLGEWIGAEGSRKAARDAGAAPARPRHSRRRHG